MVKVKVKVKIRVKVSFEVQVKVQVMVQVRVVSVNDYGIVFVDSIYCAYHLCDVVFHDVFIEVNSRCNVY